MVSICYVYSLLPWQAEVRISRAIWPTASSRLPEMSITWELRLKKNQRHCIYGFLRVSHGWCAQKTVLFWIRIRIDLAVLNPEPYWECRSGPMHENLPKLTSKPETWFSCLSKGLLYHLRYVFWPIQIQIIFSCINKEIQMESAVKSYMRKGFLIYEELRKYLVINE
jgi:hypothetical protein